jgi:hypothetical protein
MKKLLLLLALACCTGMGYAQKLVSGSLAALSHETRLNVEIDYSEAVLNNLTLDDFVATNDKWELAQTELWTKFVEKLNEGMSRATPWCFTSWILTKKAISARWSRLKMPPATP